MLTRRALGVGFSIGFILFMGLMAWVSRRDAVVPPGAVCEADGREANLDFTLKDVHGADVHLSDYRGKVLLVDFWATWCAPCKLEIPGFVSLYDTYRAQGFEVVGLVSMDEMKNVPAFAGGYKMNYPLLDANDRPDVEQAFGPIVGLPTTIVIGRDGKICHTHLGFTPFERFEAEIKSLL